MTKKSNKNSSLSSKPEKIQPRIIDRKTPPFSLDQLTKEEIIELLEPVMRDIPGFAANLAWTRQKILPKNPTIPPEELAQQLAIPLLEAYMILEQLQLKKD